VDWSLGLHGVQKLYDAKIPTEGKLGSVNTSSEFLKCPVNIRLTRVTCIKTGMFQPPFLPHHQRPTSNSALQTTISLSEKTRKKQPCPPNKSPSPTPPAEPSSTHSRNPSQTSPLTPKKTTPSPPHPSSKLPNPLPHYSMC